MKYNGIGFNGPHLSKMDYRTFRREVKHHFPGKEGDKDVRELYGLIKAKYPKTKEGGEH